MKKIFLILSSTLVLSCSSDDSSSTATTPTNNTPTPESYEITVTPSGTTVAVDETFTVDVSSDDALKFVMYSYDNFASQNSEYFGDTNDVQLQFSYAELGTKTLYIKAMNMDNEVSTIKTVSVTVVRGNALKITGIEVVSFYGMGTSWDSEYPDTDPNRLADVAVGFAKKEITNPFTGFSANRPWFVSDINYNEQSLTWDFSADSYYVQPNKTVLMEVVDDDGGVVEALMPIPVGYTIDFTPYLDTKPTSMTFSYPSYELEFIMTVEWAD